jgi:hypothetical protein
MERVEHMERMEWVEHMERMEWVVPKCGAFQTFHRSSVPPPATLRCCAIVEGNPP